MLRKVPSTLSKDLSSSSQAQPETNRSSSLSTSSNRLNSSHSNAKEKTRIRANAAFQILLEDEHKALTLETAVQDCVNLPSSTAVSRLTNPQDFKAKDRFIALGENNDPAVIAELTAERAKIMAERYLP